MTDTNKVLEELNQLVHGELKSVRKDMDEVKEGSARFNELSVKHDTIIEDVDALHAKMDTMATAMNRLSTSEVEAKADESVAEYKAAYDTYIRTADASEIKALSVGVDADGGFVAPEEMSARILENIYETSPVRQIATIQNTANKEVRFIVDIDEAGASWGSEGGVVAETTTPQLSELVIKCHKLHAEPHATEEILQDAEVNMEAWLTAKVADKFSRTENLAFVKGTGDGNNQPTGFTTYAAGTAYGQIEQITSGTIGAFDADDLIDMVGQLKTPYLQGSSWAFNRLTHRDIRKLKDSNGEYLFDGQDLINRTFLGYNVTLLEDMDNVGTGNLPIAFGDFSKAYTIVDRAQTNVLRDPYTSKGFIKFYTTRRVGGAVTNFEAIKLLTIA